MSRNFLYQDFFYYPKSSETYANPSLKEIRAKLIFFIEKYLSQTLEIKILLHEQILRKSENCSCIPFRTLCIFWDKKLNFSTSGGRELGEGADISSFSRKCPEGFNGALNCASQTADVIFPSLDEQKLTAPNFNHNKLAHCFPNYK